MKYPQNIFTVFNTTTSGISTPLRYVPYL